MGQTLLALKQLKIGIKQPKKVSFTLICFSNELNMLDLPKHRSRHSTTYPVLTSSLLNINLRLIILSKTVIKKTDVSFHNKLHQILPYCCISILTICQCVCFFVCLFVCLIICIVIVSLFFPVDCCSMLSFIIHIYCLYIYIYIYIYILRKDPLPILVVSYFEFLF